MMLFILILFVVSVAVIVIAATRDLYNIREAEPGTEDDDANTIRIAG